MAVVSKSLPHLILILGLLFMIAMQNQSDCVAEQGCLYAMAIPDTVLNRKGLYRVERKEVVLGSNKRMVAPAVTSSGKGKNLVGWELRAAPLGPDPLHHNGVGPKKPRTP